MNMVNDMIMVGFSNLHPKKKKKFLASGVLSEGLGKVNYDFEKEILEQISSILSL